MGMKFELNGVDELVKKLKKLQKESVEKIAPKALKQAAGVCWDQDCLPLSWR